jgi:catechol 2,3-dioxygenase-like lactoylglutathione lyase family enzyme
MVNQRSSPVPAPKFHHIGVQTNDLANSTAWYKAFFGAHEKWSLETFSELTSRRLPGIRRLVETAIGDGVRVHLFEREGRAAPGPNESVTQFQHVCMAVGDPEHLITLRERWIALFESGQFAYAVAEEATPVVADADGVHSFYAYDVNGLEFEFTYVPPAV